MKPLPLAVLLLAGCTFTTHPAVPYAVTRSAQPPSSWAEALSGSTKLKWEPVLSARWKAPRDGLLNLSYPEAKELPHDEMDIVLPVHLLTHPTRGLYAIDTGVSESLAKGEGGALKFPLAGFLKTVAPVESLAAILRRQAGPLNGVFFTHLHPDHVLGLPDVPAETPLFTGPGEASSTSFEGLFMRGSYAALFFGHQPTQELMLSSGIDVSTALDFFHDGSLWVIGAAGHTPGSLVFLANTTHGPVLFLGDTSHTRFGWEHSVEPGSYTKDQPANRLALERLKALEQQIPNLTVLAGHEWEPAAGGLPSAQ